MDRTVDAASAEKRRVRSIHDRVHILTGRQLQREPFPFSSFLTLRPIVFRDHHTRGPRATAFMAIRLGAVQLRRSIVVIDTAVRFTGVE